MSIQTSPQVQITFSIQTCKCLLFELTDFGKENKLKIPNDKFGFNFSFKFDLDEKRQIAIISVSSILSSLADAPGELAKLDALNEFVITNFDQVVTRNPDGLLAIPDPILISFLSISISNLRGIYAVKLEDTLYLNATLPLIDASILIPKKMPFLG